MLRIEKTNENSKYTIFLSLTTLPRMYVSYSDIPWDIRGVFTLKSSGQADSSGLQQRLWVASSYVRAYESAPAFAWGRGRWSWGDGEKQFQFLRARERVAERASVTVFTSWCQAAKHYHARKLKGHLRILESLAKGCPGKVNVWRRWPLT